MQISQIRNYNISTKQNLKKNNVAFQQAPIDKTLKTVMNNPNSKKVFIKLAEVIGLSTIIAWVSHLTKNNNDEVAKALNELEISSENKCNEFLLNTDTMDKYLEITSVSDEIDSILATTGHSEPGNKLDVSTNEIQEESVALLSNPLSREVYINNRKDNVVKSLAKQTDAILKATEEQREKFIKALEEKISGLTKKVHELSLGEKTKDLLAVIKNIAKMQSLITFVEQSKSIVETQDDEVVPEDVIEEPEIVIPIENEKLEEKLEPVAVETINDVAENKIVGPKVLGKIDVSKFERKVPKKIEKLAEPVIELKDIVITPENEKLVKEYRKIFNEVNGKYPIEAYTDKLGQILEIYNAYSKPRTRYQFIQYLATENLNKALDQYAKFVSEKTKSKIEFINFYELEMLKAQEKGTLTEEDISMIVEDKDTVLKYFNANPDRKYITLSFRKEIPVLERLKCVADYHRVAFNVMNEVDTNEFEEPVEVNDIKMELIKRLCDKSDDYKKVLSFLGVNADIPKIIERLRENVTASLLDKKDTDLNNQEEKEALEKHVSEGIYTDAKYTLGSLFDNPDIEMNFERLASLMNTDKFSGFFGSTHSRMRFFERFVLENYDSETLLEASEADEKTQKLFDKSVKKGILDNISILKKQIQNAKEIDVYNYIANKDSRKIEQISMAKITLDDVVISLNSNGEIHTIFIKE